MGTVTQSSQSPQFSTLSLTMAFLFPGSKDAEDSGIRQNYPEECEALVNKHINMELYASYVYIAMANYFTEADQALPGFAHFFRISSRVMRNHGAALMEYQARRGGKVVLQDITKPSRMEWGTAMEAMAAVLEMEKMVILALQDLQTLAMEKKDFHLVDFIQREFLRRKVNSIREMERMMVTHTMGITRDPLEGEMVGKQVETA